MILLACIPRRSIDIENVLLCLFTTHLPSLGKFLFKTFACLFQKIELLIFGFQIKRLFILHVLILDQVFWKYFLKCMPCLFSFLTASKSRRFQKKKKNRILIIIYKPFPSMIHAFSVFFTNKSQIIKSVVDIFPIFSSKFL